ncbi:hypothetical protein D1164_19505 [Mariniphaga sediminis]|jgi:hypothetical protein|uniref:Uncharacterized protein n=1 Tax=Mariniphaga sediminis TaxID=1628158 RepID=A0A399CUD9_9BACT|nr:hypothetical protein [Mariniphaga sediminis]RIH63465.1 hypothetical protein D1164_19505 [Mariniphaga sediminis]
MSFNIDAVVSDMASAIKDVTGSHWNKVKGTADQFLQNRKESLALIAELRITGELSEEKFKSRLQDEKLIAEAQLNALAVISKAIAQKAANAAIEVLEKAAKTALGSIL